MRNQNLLVDGRPNKMITCLMPFLVLVLFAYRRSHPVHWTTALVGRTRRSLQTRAEPTRFHCGVGLWSGRSQNLAGSVLDLLDARRCWPTALRAGRPTRHRPQENQIVALINSLVSILQLSSLIQSLRIKK